MADFHRFITPTYTGGLPGNYDLLNVVSGGIGAGDGSANVEPQKPPPHVNAGTYFVAFGEDATSGDVNRGMRALGDNTDFLDDVTRRDLAVPTITAPVFAAVDVSQIVIPGTVYVGGGGTPDDIASRNALVVLLDAQNIPLHGRDLPTPGSPYDAPQITKIHDGSGTNVVGNGYHDNPTLDISPPIRQNLTYRAAYLVRGNLVGQPEALVSRLVSGWNATNELWAFTRNILQINQTFLGNNTHEGTDTFNSVATFNSLAIFNVLTTFNAATSMDVFGIIRCAGDAARLVFTLSNPTAINPRIDFDTQSPHQFMGRIRVEGGAPSTFYREYGEDLIGSPTLAHVFNAQWDETSTEWIADNIAAEASKLVEGAGSLTLQTKVPSGTLSASWGDSAWTGTGSGTDINTSVGFFRHAVVQTIGGSTDYEDLMALSPLALRTIGIDVGAISADTLLFIDEYYISTGAQPDQQLLPRLYGGSESATSNTRFGLIQTINAEWNYSTGRYGADDTSEPAYSLHTHKGLEYGVRRDTSGSWFDANDVANGWETLLKIDENEFRVPTGDFVVPPGQFRYATNNVVSRLLSIYEGFPVTDNDGGSGEPDWFLFDNHWEASTAPLASIARLCFPIDIPMESYSASKLLGVDVIVKPGVGTSGMNVSIQTREPNFSVPGDSSWSSIASDTADNSTDYQVLTAEVGGSEDLNNTNEVRVVVQGGGTPAAHLVVAVRLRYAADSFGPVHG